MSNPMQINMLVIMGVLHFVIMFFAMYSMIFTLNHFHFNINKIYMAVIMTAPMLILEVWLMGKMYENKKALLTITVLSVIALIVVFLFIREQTFIYDKPFLKSMIPHHSSAILMCEKASIEDREIKELCDQIVKTQREEINQMNKILDRLNTN